LSVLRTYSTPLWTVRLLGKWPPEATVDAFLRPPLVTRNEVIESLPALTTNSSLWLGVSTTSPWVSRLGHPVGGVQPGSSCSAPATSATDAAAPNAFQRRELIQSLLLGYFDV